MADYLVQKKINDAREQVASLGHLQEEVQVAPVDAKVEYLNNEFTITNEVNGSTIDQEKLISEIKLAFSEGKLII